MRTIKAKAKKLNGNWVFGYFNLCPDGNPFIRDEEYGISVFNIDPKTISHFTGLKDINKVDIYEHDFVVVPNEYPFYTEDGLNYIGVVEWIYSQWQYELKVSTTSKAGGCSDGINHGLNDDGEPEGGIIPFKIIGNKFDNIDLIKYNNYEIC